MPICSRCETGFDGNKNFCPACGSGVNDETCSAEPPHVGVIAIMWLLTLGYFVFDAQRSSGLASVCGLPSFGIGIYLATRQNGVDRVNGWVRVGIGIVMGLIIFTLLTLRQ